MLKDLKFNPLSPGDDRVKKYIVPKKIIKVTGDVKDYDALLDSSFQQIGLIQKHTATLTNRKNEEHAGILLDFGQEIHGGIKILTFHTHQDNCVKMRLCFGESVSEALSKIGEKNSINHHSPRDFIITIPSLSGLEFGETGFRFVYLELLSEDTWISLKSVNGVLIYRDLIYKGSFECNDKLVNQIFDTAAYTCHLNMQEMLWDGIKRDRLVWIGDMHPEMMTIKYVFGEDRCIEEGLAFVCGQTELPNWMNEILSYSIWWLIIAADWYFYTGKDDFIRKEQKYITELLYQLANLIHEDGTDDFKNWQDNGTFFDWSTHGKPTAADGVRALFVRGMKAGTMFGNMFEDNMLANTCLEAIERIKKIIPVSDQSKQTAAMITLTGEFNNTFNAQDILIKDSARGVSTFMSYYIFKAVSKNGNTGYALDMMRQYYGGMLSMGATTFWEDFNVDWLENACPIDREPREGESDIHGDKGAMCYEGFRHSLCHGWSSGPVPFLMEEVLGIKILEPGCKKIQISPKLGGLTYAKGTFPTPQGNIAIHHKIKADGSIETKYTAPAGVEVVLV